MPVRLARGARWPALMDHLVAAVGALGLGPFDGARVLVATQQTGRVVGQEVAARIGISAGIDYLTFPDLMRDLAEHAGVAGDRGRWLGSPLDLAVQSALDEVAAEHPLLRAALDADDTRPGRRRATAVRLARLLRSYLDLAPGLVATWLDGVDTGPGGRELPETAAWQPPLMRAVVEHLELDPLDVLAAIRSAAERDATPTLLVGVDQVTEPQRRIVESLAAGRTVTLIQKAGSRGELWAAELATRTIDLPGEPAPLPTVFLHDSHGEARQVEVLRDELTRAFDEDPTLEPRHVVVVCPQLDRYAPLLDAAFTPGDAGATHPGRQLRVQPAGVAAPNPLMLVLVDLLRLGDSRATAGGLVDLLLRPPIAHRWRLADRAVVVELVRGAGVRWGMDTTHRARFGLGDIAQNTWLRGLDRLLVGLAVAPEDDAGLGLSGTEAVTASDMDTVGSLCELVSRLRRLISVTADPTSVPGWAARCRDAINTLVGLPRGDEWQLTATARVLTRLETDHAADPSTLTRHEFTLLLADEAAGYRRRPAAGNGSLLVLPLGELPHVEFRLVALLGVTDDVVPGRLGLPADCLDLGDAAPDPRTRRREQLLDHARAAERLLIVRQARSQRTNDPAALPVAVSWLLDRLGAAPTPVEHPPTATSEDNFRFPASFDPAAYAGAVARRARVPLPRRQQRRRTAARTRPVGPPPPQVSVGQLARFLADPARAFLQTVAGITVHPGPELTDDIPLTSSGLDRWSIVNDLLKAWKSGLGDETVETALRQREVHPPLEIGRSAFEVARRDARALWERASDQWSAQLAEHPVRLTLELPGLGTTTLLDEVRTRGGVALTVTASSGDEQLIAPWLESLALAAAGHAVPARLHRLIRVYGDTLPDTQEFTATDPTQAVAQLTAVTRAFALGQHRLLPLPAAPAIRVAQEVQRASFDRAEWTGPFRSYRTKWNWPGRTWEVFYESDVAELLEDEPLPEDPATDEKSAFVAWAVELFGPLVGSLR